MSATIRLSGPLKDFNHGKVELEVQPGGTVRQAVSAIGIVPETIAVVIVNEEMMTKDYVIQEGDVIRVLAIIGGG